MIEISWKDLPSVVDRYEGGEDIRLWVTLVFQPKQPSFYAAKEALKLMGAKYIRPLTAWKVPIDYKHIEPLIQLYRQTSAAMWITGPGEDLKAEMFSRYDPADQWLAAHDPKGKRSHKPARRNRRRKSQAA